MAPDDSRVVAAIDNSPYAESIVEHGAWAATELQAPLDLVHTYNLNSITNTAENPSTELPAEMTEGTLEDVGALHTLRIAHLETQGQALLRRAQAKATTLGISEITLLQREGGLLETLLTLQPHMRLLVIGKRGHDADFSKTQLGGNLERIVRSVTCPVLVAGQAFRPIARFMMAYDGSMTTRRYIEAICAGRLLRHATCHLIMVGDDDAKHRTHMNWAIDRLHQAGFDPRTEIVMGEPDAIVAQRTRDWNIDLLLMGAYSHSWLRNLIIGSTTTRLLLNATTSVLLLR